MHRGVGRWFDKGGLYRSIGKGSKISMYKIQPSYITIKRHTRGAPAPGAPMVPMPMMQILKKELAARFLYNYIIL
jgi:hypothetical protein